MSQLLNDKLKRLDLLPAPPVLAMKILDLVREDAPIDEIAETISRDPVLAAKLLKTANSSFYRRSHTVSTIRHATTLLGLQNVRTLVLGFSFVNALKGHKPRAFDYQKYWRRSIYAAAAARAMAGKLKLIQREECFLAALLADIGMLALDQAVDIYAEVCRNATSHEDLAAIEQDVLGVTHADASLILARQWKLPAILAIPMGAHHTPEFATDAFGVKMAQIVHTAGLAADVFIEERPAEHMLQLRQSCQSVLAIGATDTDLILQEVAASALEVAPIFDISMQTPPDLVGIAVKAAQMSIQPKPKAVA